MDGTADSKQGGQPEKLSATPVPDTPARANDKVSPSLALNKAELDLMHRILDECHVHILAASANSQILPEFLAGLTANESGGNAQARRFEPGVFEHLKAVAQGRATRFGAIGAKDLQEAERGVEAIRSPEYHARFLNTVFAANHALSISELQEDALRVFASSWGYTQVMGYHLIGRKGSIEDLCNPHTHYTYAVGLLSEFIRQFRLDPRKDIESLFHCWNSGRPSGKTFDPAYVPNGLRRSAIYRDLMVDRKAFGNSSGGGQRPASPEPSFPARPH